MSKIHSERKLNSHQKSKSITLEFSDLNNSQMSNEHSSIICDTSNFYKHQNTNSKNSIINIQENNSKRLIKNKALVNNFILILSKICINKQRFYKGLAFNKILSMVLHSNSNTLFNIKSNYQLNGTSSFIQANEIYPANTKNVQKNSYLINTFSNIDVNVDEESLNIPEKEESVEEIDLEEYLKSDSIRSICLILTKIFRKDEIKLKSYFLQTLKVYSIYFSMEKCFIFKTLNKIYAIRNLVIKSTYNEGMLYRCYFLKWKFHSKEREKMILKRNNNLLRFIDKENCLKEQRFKKFLVFQRMKLHNLKISMKERHLYIKKLSMKIKYFVLKLFILLNNLQIKRKNQYFKRLYTFSIKVNSIKRNELSNNVRKLKNFVLSNLYDLTNDQNEGIMLKEKFYDQTFDEKKIFRHSKSIFILSKTFSFNKSVVKYFKLWHKIILQENVQEIFFIMDNVRGEIDVLKIKNFVKILDNKLTKTFRDLMIRICKKNKKKYEITFLYNNILFMENFYNNKLLRCCKAIQKLFLLISKKKRYVLRRNNIEKKSVNLLANRIGTYFEMWKLKFTRIKQFIKFNYHFYIRILSFLDILLGKMKFQARLFFLKIFKNYHQSKRIFRKQSISAFNRLNNIIRIHLFYNKMLFYTHFKKIFEEQNVIPIKLTTKSKLCSIIFSVNKILERIRSNIMTYFHIYLKQEKDREREEIQERKFKLYTSKFLSYYSFINRLKYIHDKYKRVFLEKFKSRYKPTNKNIDYYIMTNCAEVNISIEKEINRKAKLNFVMHILHKMIHLKTKTTLLKSISLKYTYFNRLKLGVLIEKRELVQEIKTLQKNNEDVATMIGDYENEINLLENKLKECTVRAEKCDKCTALIQEEETSKSMISVKDEAFDNNIQYFRAKSLLGHDSPKKNSSFEKSKNEKEVSLNENKHNLNHDENILSIENENNNRMNDNFQLDENTGMEYYSYLEKTYKDLNTKIYDLDYEYSIKTNNLKMEIDNLLLDVDQLVNKKI